MSGNDSSRLPLPEHDHGDLSEQEARIDGAHGWGYGGRPAEEAVRPSDEEDASGDSPAEAGRDEGTAPPSGGAGG